MSDLDFALASESDGTILLHRPDCEDVRRAAETGEIVITMLGCVRTPRVQRHSCLPEIEQ